MTNEEALEGFKSLAELVRGVCYEHQRYKLYAQVYRAHLYIRSSFDAYELAKEAVAFMDAVFEHPSTATSTEPAP
jgi:hypothetical protein